MKIIILSPPNDSHTAPIKWALEQAGYEVACWQGLSWNEQQQASIAFNHQSSITLGPYTVEPDDVVWIRRPEPPLHNPKVSPEDKKFAELEYRFFYAGIAYMLEALPVRCINRYSAYRFTNNKAVQLHLARACGLRIPKTLMSNCPQRVRDFMDLAPRRMICKPLFGHSWQSQSTGGSATAQTFELTSQQLPGDEILTYAPAIYQEMVVKEFDVRAVLMGNNLYSYALRHPEKVLDWRMDSMRRHLQISPIPTPRVVESAVLAFAQRTGVCFGSIDFAVDADGQWWFLEINEQGQFLWLDDAYSQGGIQEKFCAFLTKPEDSTSSLEETANMFPSFANYQEFLEKEGIKVTPWRSPNLPFLSQEP